MSCRIGLSRPRTHVALSLTINLCKVQWRRLAKEINAFLTHPRIFIIACVKLRVHTKATER